MMILINITLVTKLKFRLQTITIAMKKKLMEKGMGYILEKILLRLGNIRHQIKI